MAKSEGFMSSGRQVRRYFFILIVTIGVAIFLVYNNYQLYQTSLLIQKDPVQTVAIYRQYEVGDEEYQKTVKQYLYTGEKNQRHVRDLKHALVKVDFDGGQKLDIYYYRQDPSKSLLAEEYHNAGELSLIFRNRMKWIVLALPGIFFVFSFFWWIQDRLHGTD